ncbi:SRPBCC family protein [Arenimonas composti]|uniref:Polyketide cyclase n=1 Tax=Arenimonas composti TR7-09 = DSM 18010 TaxID=1121013 RepID=A0A091BDW0_9GAMM|nr:SRPBCC family protein [Arenimonas composti]KFN49727.1 hypothetical protein P873_09220 [Arenimonas composti TR7-09 = DSM 18010]
MTRVIEWLISLAIVAVLFVLIGVFLPSKRSVSHEIETNRPMSTVTDLVGSFTRFRDWNALINHDPQMKIDISGPEHGVGARLDYQSRHARVGGGSWELVEEIPGERMVYAVTNNRRGDNKRMTFTFERTGQRNQNVKITQRYTVDYGWDLLGRYAGMYATDVVGDDIKLGLGKLANLLATIPRFDYSVHPNEFQVVDFPAQNVLLANADAQRTNDDIALAMTNQLKWIERVMEENNLERAGPMRIVTNEFNTERYNFDVVVPIRRKGTGPADASAPAAAADADAETDAAGEGDAAANADEPAFGTGNAPLPATDGAPLERFELKLEGDRNPVIYAQTPAFRAATTTYVGPSPGLARVRDLVRAWAIVRGYEVYDRAIEDYQIEIRNMLNDDALFRVYYPVRRPGETTGVIEQINPPPQADEDEAPAAVEEGSGEEAAAPAGDGEAATAE